MLAVAPQVRHRPLWLARSARSAGNAAASGRPVASNSASTHHAWHPPGHCAMTESTGTKADARTGFYGSELVFQARQLGSQVSALLNHPILYCFWWPDLRSTDISQLGGAGAQWEGQGRGLP